MPPLTSSVISGSIGPVPDVAIDQQCTRGGAAGLHIGTEIEGHVASDRAKCSHVAARDINRSNGAGSGTDRHFVTGSSVDRAEGERETGSKNKPGTGAPGHVEQTIRPDKDVGERDHRRRPDIGNAVPAGPLVGLLPDQVELLRTSPVEPSFWSSMAKALPKTLVLETSTVPAPSSPTTSVPSVLPGPDCAMMKPKA